MLYGSIRRNLYAHLSVHKMRWTLVFDYLFTPISTPKWHESIWFCMKFYEFTISKNLVTMRFYGLLLRYIDLWKKANLQRYLISCYQLPCSEIPGFQDVLPFSFFPYTARANPGWICPIQHYIIAHPCGFGKRWFWGSALYWPGSGVGSGVMCPGPGRGSLHPTCQKFPAFFEKCGTISQRSPFLAHFT